MARSHQTFSSLRSQGEIRHSGPFAIGFRGTGGNKMADETSALSDKGDSTKYTVMQDSDTSTQEEDQNQESDQRSTVGTIDEKASSKDKQGRSKGSWATERIVERAIKRQLSGLEDRIFSLLQRQNPPAVHAVKQSDSLGDPDYNNLNGWLRSAVDKLLQDKLAESLPQHLDQFKGELRNVSKIQEARNFLLSQEDIGGDEDKLAEIEQIIKNNLLGYAVQHEPLKAVKKAIEIWRKERVNPNTPTRGQLSTVPGGIGSKGKRDLSVEGLRALQLKIASGLPVDEQERVFSQVDSLLTQ